MLGAETRPVLLVPESLVSEQRGDGVDSGMHGGQNHSNARLTESQYSEAAVTLQRSPQQRQEQANRLQKGWQPSTLPTQPAALPQQPPPVGSLLELQQQLQQARQHQSQLYQRQQQQQQQSVSQLHASAPSAAESADADTDAEEEEEEDGKPPREAAIELVVEGGASAADAAVAVDAVASADSAQDSPDSWADAAIIWLATDLEQRAERESLAAAMAVSLRQEEERSSEKLPLVQQSVAELRQHFCHSKLLEQLMGTPFGEGLFQVPLRQWVVPLLELERKYCRIWYPGHAAQQYFKQLGKDLVQQAGTAASSSGAAQTPQVPPELPPELPSPAARSWSRRKRKFSSPDGDSKRQRCSLDRVHQAAATRQAGHTVRAADSLPDSPCTIPGAADWAAVISVRVGELQEATAEMPSNPGDLPDFLQPFKPAYDDGPVLIDVE